MERGVLQSPPLQQIMGGSPSWWNMNIPRTSPQQASHPLTSPSSSSSALNQYPPSNFLPMASWLDNQELPMSWSQLLMGGLEERDDRCSPTLFQPTRVEEGWDDQVLYRSGSADKDHVKQEISGSGGYVYGHRNEEFLETWPSRNQILPTVSSRSSLTSSMLDFANRKAERRNHQLNHSSEFNSTSKGSSFKKARVQASSIFQVRREKLGDKITALHQIVSPFGKTDTASVLLEAIGYIRFLQSQIEALSSPYLASELGNMMPSAQRGRSCMFREDPSQLLDDTHNMKRRGPSDQGCDNEPNNGLRSRGLCLVPMSLILKVGIKNTDYYTSDFTGVFR